MPSPFDPANGLWSPYPYIAKPYIAPWSTGNAVGYLQGVLRLKAGQTNVYVAPAGGPWNFDQPTYQGLINVQNWCGLAPSGTCDPGTWALIDWLATH